MKIQPLLRIAHQPVLLLALSGCAVLVPGFLFASAKERAADIEQPPPTQQAMAVSGTPSLPGIPYLGFPSRVEDAPPQSLPQEIADLLLSLPPADFDLPAMALQQAMQKTIGTVVEIPHIPGRPDRLMKMYAVRNSAFWVRTFESETPGTQGYLVQVKIDCDMLRNVPADSNADSPWRRCIDSDRPSMGNGLRAYRKVAGQPLADVTASITPPQHLLGADTEKRYQQQGASLPFLDGSRLDRVPVARWIVEADPENPLRKDAHTFGKGSYAHAGFLLWNGDHFETRTTVPAALWPCPRNPPQKDPWQCPKDDRFVSP